MDKDVFEQGENVCAEGRRVGVGSGELLLRIFKPGQSSNVHESGVASDFVTTSYTLPDDATTGTWKIRLYKKVCVLWWCWWDYRKTTTFTVPEPSIETILNNRYGPGCWQERPSVETFVATGGMTGYTATALVVDKQCSYTNPTGWYLAGNPTATTELWADPDPADTGDITTSNAFGLYINSNNGDGSTYYTQTGLNPDEGAGCGQAVHANVYEIICGPIDADYVVAFEDLPCPTWDEDYNDVVIELKDVTDAIPEFATIAIPAASVLGLFLYFNRRKQNEN